VKDTIDLALQETGAQQVIKAYAQLCRQIARRNHAFLTMSLVKQIME
jgi:hypothetical protein